MKNNLIQIGIPILTVVSLLLLTDPFMYLMPPMGVMIALVSATVLLVVWSGFVMFESAVDEREALHRMYAGRAAYLAGIAILTAALLFQGLTDSIDPWLAASLGVMVLVKMGARLFYESRG
jgi:hypothetical protein